MPLSMLDRVGQVVVKPTRMTLQLADRSIKYPYGVIENMLVKVDKFTFLVDFVVMDMEEDSVIPIILRRPFMKIARAIIDVGDGELKLRVHDEVITFNVFEAMTHPNDKGACFRMDVLDEVVCEATKKLKKSVPDDVQIHKLGAISILVTFAEFVVHTTDLSQFDTVVQNDFQLLLISR
uniref:Uncharacterized protein n=2 Tax=Cajanus cajan TaxID=3821 RepID=A0A151SFN1_CAJCA|nr:hypothetical protein KK1_024492 [Cajanus cajan]